MTIFLTPQTNNSSNLVLDAAGSHIKRNKKSYSHKCIDTELPLSDKVHSASLNYTQLITKERPAYNKYIRERYLVEELYVKIQNELKKLCKGNTPLKSKFLLGQSIPNNYFQWSVHIKETIMALLLHEEIYQNLDSIGVTEEILDDLLIRLKDLDDLKFMAVEEGCRI